MRKIMRAHNRIIQRSLLVSMVRVVATDTFYMSSVGFMFFISIAGARSQQRAGSVSDVIRGGSTQTCIIESYLLQLSIVDI